MIEDILKIIGDTFDECVTVNAFETITGIENEIEGKEEFMTFLKDRLSEKITKPKFPYSVRMLTDVLIKEKRALVYWKNRSDEVDIHVDNGEVRIKELTNALTRLNVKPKTE